ncbi:MAG: ATP-dependent helicase [Candidatus Omnitrophica bacterium]|nr:ATP-dependent helicase [Candidatus Omnitrophota bacterium]
MDAFDKYYNKLNENQKKAVDITDGPLLILAGPGTGKTELLSVRAANIIRQKKARPGNILILTYTNSAAKAMKERLVKIIGPSAHDIESATFHSFANSVILDSEDAANYIQEKIQMQDIERIRLLEYILDKTEGIDAIRPMKSPYFYRQDIERRISDLKREAITPVEFSALADSFKPDGVLFEEKHAERIRALALAYKLYEEYKDGKNEDIFDSRGRYDYDDMIIFAVKAVKNEKYLRSRLQEEYKYIMVDEFQDTNGAQLKLLFELAAGKSPNLCCVGDDDQAIYRFQGASVANFRILREKLSDMTEVSLKDNYRSTKEIIKLAGNIIRHIPSDTRVTAKDLVSRKDYKDKTIEFHEFSTGSAELIYITDRIRDIHKNVDYNDIAVLVRKRDDVLKVVDAFLGAGIPYATDGKEDISGENRVRQMLDVLEFAHLKNTADYASKDSLFYRIITSDYLGVKMTDVLKFISYVNGKKREEKDTLKKSQIAVYTEFINLFTASNAEKAECFGREIGLSDTAQFTKAASVIKSLLDGAETKPVHTMFMEYIKSAGVYKYILSSYNDNEVLRIRDLRALCSFINMVKIKNVTQPGVRLADFMDEIETMLKHGLPLVGKLVTMTQDGVRVFTAHGSKGLEFHTVIIPFCLQKKNWPMQPLPNKIPLPAEMYNIGGNAMDKEAVKEMSFYDETRLFYVASTRAKSNLIYTSSPTESAVSSLYLASAGLSADEPESGMKEETLLGKSLALAEEKEPFIGTEKVLRDLVSDLTLNPTKLNNYIKCRRKFLYDNVLLLPARKNVFLTFGNCVHKALEDAYGCLIKTGKFPDFDFFNDLFKRELMNQGVDRSIEADCNKWLPSVKNWYIIASKSPVKPIALEESLEIALPGKLIFRGKLDKTEFVDEKKGLVRVLDYKTGPPDEHVKNIYNVSDLKSRECDDYLRQLVAYKLLFEKSKKNAGLKVTEGTLVFTAEVKATVLKYGLKKGAYINKTVELSDDMVEQLEDVIKNCWRDINALKFEKLENTDENRKKTCNKCEYNDICWER